LSILGAREIAVFDPEGREDAKKGAEKKRKTAEEKKEEAKTHGAST